jgi:hypothetical protein
VIKAIGVSQANPNAIFVATEDGTFFYSISGLFWNKNINSLPSSLIPWDIITSKFDANDIFISGTGYSNSGVFRSKDGGQSFQGLATDIPSATFHEIALSDNEEVLFAATTEGPYAYVFQDEKWYSLTGAETPIVDFNTVDNLGNDHIRFGTYGRGIWDFESSISINPSSISDKERLDKVSFYPNPVQKGQNIRIKPDSKLIGMNVDFYNFNGQKVYSGIIEKDYTIKNNLKPGAYITKIGLSELLKSQKIIVLD